MTFKYRPKPRYAKPVVETRPDLSRSTSMPDFTSSNDIRDAIYKNWYKERKKRALQEKKTKEEMEKQEIEKKKQV